MLLILDFIMFCVFGFLFYCMMISVLQRIDFIEVLVSVYHIKFNCVTLTIVYCIAGLINDGRLIYLQPYVTS